MTLGGLFPTTAMPDRAWWHELWPDPDKVIHLLGIASKDVVLDVGCGDGYFTAAIARHARKVIGLDLDPDLLATARSSCEHLGNCDWLLGDAMQLPQLVSVKVDYVLIANTFHGAPDKTGLAREVAAVSKHGARLAVVNWHARPREQTTVLGKPRGPATELRMTPADVQRVIEPAGFQVNQVIELPPYHYAEIFFYQGTTSKGDTGPAGAEHKH